MTWDASSKTKLDVRLSLTYTLDSFSSERDPQAISIQSNSPLTTLVADSADSPIVVAGFADGAVKAYDRRIRDAESVMRTYQEHSSWIVGARCQKYGSKEFGNGKV